MIYLKKEKEQFEDTKAAFGAAYATLMQRMAETCNEKGEDRDTGSPIHHRMSPHDMLAILQAKSRRVESILSAPGWEEDPAALAKVIEESVDIPNYSLFIAALCSLLLEEAEHADSTSRPA